MSTEGVCTAWDCVKSASLLLTAQLVNMKAVSKRKALTLIRARAFPCTELQVLLKAPAPKSAWLSAEDCRQAAPR